MVDTPTGMCYYVDNSGHVKKASIQSGIDVSVTSPDGWMSIELGFGRNMVYYGLNRSYSTPMKMVKDAYTIVKELLYNGLGIETPLTLITLKYNALPAAGEPQYKLYNKCQIDLTKFKHIQNEGIELNAMEGGIIQLLKAYEDMTFEIPVDGSIAENIKVNLDGLLVEDTLHYQIVPMKPMPGGALYNELPLVFVNNDGDNFGIIHQDPSFDDLGEIQNVTDPNGVVANNYLLTSLSAITVEVSGSIQLSPWSNQDLSDISLLLVTDKASNPADVANTLKCAALVPAMAQNTIQNNNQVQRISSAGVFYFSQTITLAAYERLFFILKSIVLSGHSGRTVNILGGTLDIKLKTMAQTTTCWGLTAWDLYRLLIKKICSAASTTNQVFNYQPNSTLLQNNLNIFCTSGDAIRASGDANYQQFFQVFQTNSQQPSNNLTISYGPVIKTSLSDFYKAMSTVLCASLGNEQLDNLGEAIFLEQLGYVFNTSNQFSVGEVSKLTDSLATEYMYNSLEIGYKPQTYDQKSGKYEYNTTAKWAAPIKTLNKKLEIISPYRTDSYGIERLRANIGDTSTTRNSGDNDVFMINIDNSQFVYDKEQATYTGNGVTDPINSANNNIRLLQYRSIQSIPYQNLTGSYFSMLNDPSIFVFCYPGYSATIPLKFVLSGNLLGLPANTVTGLSADTITIRLYVKGVCVLTSITTVNSASTAIGSNTVNTVTAGAATNSGASVEYDLTTVFNEGDSIYAVASTSLNGSIENLSCSLALGAGGSYWSASSGGVIKVDTGTPVAMLAMPIVNPPNPQLDPTQQPVVSYGFQYFLFDSLLTNSSFDIAGVFDIATSTNPLFSFPNQHVTLYLYVNGVVVDSATVGDTQPTWPGQTLNYSRDFEIGDVVFVVASTQVVAAGIYNAALTLTSKTIKAYSLKRVQYDAISGIPALLGYLPGTNTPVTTGPGAPYNIEDFTPKRLLNKWAARLAMGVYNQPGRALQFLTLSKNQYLSTSLNGVTYGENLNVAVEDLGQPLAYPYYFEFDTKVPINFADLLTEAANAHIHFTYGGVNFYGFPMDVKQKPALEESQQWKLLASPANDITSLAGLTINGLNTINMQPNSIWCAFTSPVQFVPAGQILGAKYHTPDINLFWFSEQISKWLNQKNYWNPLQTNDTLFLQFYTNGLAPVTVKLLKDDGTQISETTFSLIATNATPYSVWEGTIDLSTLSPGGYYLVATGGTGGNAAVIISEGIHVKNDWPNTLLVEYNNTENKLGMLFENGEQFAIRFKGFLDNKLKPKFKAAFFVDQPQDISLLNAFPYEIRELWVGLDDGVPDYLIKKLSRIMLLDTLFIEGVQYSINEGSEWEEVFIEGNPKKYWKIDIRPSKNIDGISATASGFASSSTMLITTDANYFGPNVNNASLTTETDIINVEIAE